MSRLYKALPHLAFAALAASMFSPSPAAVENPWVLFAAAAAIEAALVVKRKSKSAHDIALGVFVFLFLWEYLSTRTGWTNTLLVPIPERVFAVFYTDWRKILAGLGSSLALLGAAFGLALSLAVALGMAAGWFERARNAVLPLAKVISPVPPIVYTPYVVALFPTFRSASIFIIFNSIFWPTLITMIINVSTVDRRVMDSARTLNTKSLAMFLHILFPYCLPRLITGMNITLSTSFMVLTAAELIGATSGLGWFVRYYSDFADYTRVAAGIIMIALTVTLLNNLLLALEKRLIKWQ
ncbi:MAG: ABC transporter permease subunit [Treponema sp.]|jgi:NitT/TauT family transport system permease protein|nr:ABC transporter permease subunit [Treponema sp.]